MTYVRTANRQLSYWLLRRSLILISIHFFYGLKVLISLSFRFCAFNRHFLAQERHARLNFSGNCGSNSHLVIYIKGRVFILRSRALILVTGYFIKIFQKNTHKKKVSGDLLQSEVFIWPKLSQSSGAGGGGGGA